MIVSLRSPDDVMISIYDPEVVLILSSESTFEGEKLLDVYLSKGGKLLTYRSIADLEVL